MRNPILVRDTRNISNHPTARFVRLRPGEADDRAERLRQKPFDSCFEKASSPVAKAPEGSPCFQARLEVYCFAFERVYLLVRRP